jgi:hypothetical protein
MNCGQFAAVEKLERAIDSIQRTIEEDGGNLVIKMKVSYWLPKIWRLR